MADKKKYYLRNKDLLAEIKRCKEENRDQPSPELVEMFKLLVKNVMRKMYYDNEQDKDDCFQSGMMDLLKYWDRFNTDYSNPFAYYTQVCKNGIAKGWNEIHPKDSNYNISLESTASDEHDGIHSI